MIADVMPWLQPVWQPLQASINKQTCPHALMLVGQSPLTLKAFSWALAKQWLDLDTAVSLIAPNAHESLMHPNLKVLGFDEGASSIGIDEIRALDFIQLKATQNKVILIDAQKLTLASTNACLKMLEEPPANTFFVLHTQAVGHVLPTLLSRCAIIQLPTPVHSQAMAYLQQQGIEQTRALALLKQNDGEPMQAWYANQPGYEEVRQQVMTGFFNLVEGTASLEICEQWAKMDLKQALYFIYSVLSDVCLLRFGADVSSLKNQDYLDKITDVSRRLTTKDCFEWTRSFNQLVQALRQHVKVQYALQSFCIGLNQG